MVSLIGTFERYRYGNLDGSLNVISIYDYKMKLHGYI